MNSYQTTILITDLVTLESNLMVQEEVLLPMDHYELEQLIEDLLFEGAIATRQRLEGHTKIIGTLLDGSTKIELDRDEVMRLNLLLNDLQKAVA